MKSFEEIKWECYIIVIIKSIWHPLYQEWIHPPTSWVTYASPHIWDDRPIWERKVTTCPVGNLKELFLD
jgi:hypothetical protein